MSVGGHCAFESRRLEVAAWDPIGFGVVRRQLVAVTLWDLNFLDSSKS